jgi:uncharacterized protein YggE
MKNIILSFIFFIIAQFIHSQTYPSAEKKYISVTGSSEVIVIPDQIELEITLQEYIGLSKGKRDLSNIESEFFDILEKNNIDQKSLVFSNIDYSWYYYWWSCRNDTYRQKSFKIKLSSSTDFISLVNDLNIKGVKSIRISDSSHKDLQKLRKDVKIAAMRAAKEKALYLLESIDEKLGQVSSVEEVPEISNYHWGRTLNMVSNVSVSHDAHSDNIEHVASIKLRYEIKVKFEIE